MNDDDPFIPLDDEEEFNPYAAPRAETVRKRGKGDDEEEERIRRQYLSHEASVKSIGYLSALSTAGMFVLMGMAVAQAAGMMPIPVNPNGPNTPPVVFAFTAVIYLGMAILNVALAYGLIMLQNWARWTTLAFTILNVLCVLLIGVGLVATSGNAAVGFGLVIGGSIIPAYIIYLMASRKSTVVCSADYKEIIARTPHIKYKTSILVWIFLGLLVLLLVFAVVGAVVSGRR